MFLDRAIEQGLDNGYRIEHPSGITVYKVTTKESVFVVDRKRDPDNKRYYKKVTTLIPFPYLVESENTEIPVLVDKQYLISLMPYTDWSIPELSTEGS